MQMYIRFNNNKKCIHSFQGLFFNFINHGLSVYQYEPQHIHCVTDNNNNSCGILAVFSFQILFNVLASLTAVAKWIQCGKKMCDLNGFSHRKIDRKKTSVPTSSWMVFFSAVSLIHQTCYSSEINEISIIRRLKIFAFHSWTRIIYYVSTKKNTVGNKLSDCSCHLHKPAFPSWMSNGHKWLYFVLNKLNCLTDLISCFICWINWQWMEKWCILTWCIGWSIIFSGFSQR